MDAVTMLCLTFVGIELLVLLAFAVIRKMVPVPPFELSEQARDEVKRTYRDAEANQTSEE